MSTFRVNTNRVANTNGSFRVRRTVDSSQGGNTGVVLYAFGSNQYGELSMITNAPYLDTPTRIGNRWSGFHTDGINMLFVSEFGVHRHLAETDTNISLIPSTGPQTPLVTGAYIYAFLFRYYDNNPSDPKDKLVGIGIKNNDNHLYIFDLSTGQVLAQLLIEHDILENPLHGFTLVSLPNIPGPSLRNDEFTYYQITTDESFIIIGSSLYRIYYTNNQFHVIQVRSMVLNNEEESPIDISNGCVVVGGGFLVFQQNRPEDQIITNYSRIFPLSIAYNDEYDKLFGVEVLPDSYFDGSVDKTTLNITNFYANDHQMIFEASILFTQQRIMPVGIINPGIHTMRWIYSSNNTKLYLLLAVNEYGCTYAPLYNDIDNPESNNANGYMPYILGSIYENISENISLSHNTHGLGKFYDDRDDNYYIAGFGINTFGQIGVGLEASSEEEEFVTYCEPAGFGNNNPQGKILAIAENADTWPIAKRDISLIYTANPIP